MHPALLYVVHAAREDQRRMQTYLPDPDPWADPPPAGVESDARRVGPAPLATIAAFVVASRRRLGRDPDGSPA